MTAAVQELCGAVWDARHRGALKRDAREISRALARCVAQDVQDCELYDPETDVRVKWLRELCEDVRRGPKWRRPQGSVDAEYHVLMLLGRLEAQECGKRRAAGG